MKYPSYLTQEELKETANLFHIIRNRFGLPQALIFKRLSLTAAYGVIYAWKIGYEVFLRRIKRYLDKSDITTFDGFWALKKEADLNRLNQYSLNKSYHFPKDIIVYSSMGEFEKKLIDNIMDTNMAHKQGDRIQNVYKDVLREMFPNISLLED